MTRVLAYLKNPWVLILLVSVGVFTFWGGPVFTATSLSHGGRLIASYLVIPIGVATVLLWRRQWNFLNWGYLTLGIAMIKMVLTMGVHLWVIPRGARVESKPISHSAAPPVTPGYSPDPGLTFTSVRGTVRGGDGVSPCAVALLHPHAGKPGKTATHHLIIRDHQIDPAVLLAATGDTVFISNRDSTFHTFSLTDADHQLFQMPVLPGQVSNGRVLTMAGSFTSVCAHGHEDEWMRAMVFEHPYFDLCDEHGVFQLDSVPLGNIDLAVWRFQRERSRGGTTPDTIVSQMLSDTTPVSLDIVLPSLEGS